MLALLAIVAVLIAPALHDHGGIGEASHHGCEPHQLAHQSAGSVDDLGGHGLEQHDPDCHLCLILTTGTFRLGERVVLPAPHHVDAETTRPYAVVRSREIAATARPRAPPALS